MAHSSGKDPRTGTVAGRHEGTRLESVEEIRQAIKSRRTPTVAEQANDADTSSFRPLRRPPMALLCVLDDGKEDGEWVRLRQDRLVIGRSEGDVTIPHDTMLSSKHAEIVRRLGQGEHTWYLIDLESTNGTYIRIGNALLKHNQELLIGSKRYRFDAMPQGGHDGNATHADEDRRGRTSGWQSVSPEDLVPSLVELTSQGEGQRHPLNRPENWMGRDTRFCNILIGNDPLASPRHARFIKDKKGRWHVENTRSVNGVWLRVEEIALDTACQFQLGEQRFLVRIL